MMYVCTIISVISLSSTNDITWWCFLSIRILLMKCLAAPSVAHFIRLLLSWNALVHFCSIPSSDNTLNSHTAVFVTLDNATYSVSIQLKLAHFCNVLVTAMMACPYINMNPLLLLPFRSISFAKPLSTSAFIWSLRPGRNNVSLLKVPRRYLSVRSALCMRAIVGACKRDASMLEAKLRSGLVLVVKYMKLPIMIQNIACWDALSLVGLLSLIYTEGSNKLPTGSSWSIPVSFKCLSSTWDCFIRNNPSAFDVSWIPRKCPGCPKP